MGYNAWHDEQIGVDVGESAPNTGALLAGASTITAISGLCKFFKDSNLPHTLR
tara:strand:- start:79 stop:237 length:159 start_codon:yes stop_codon:yes gene_type:complete